MDDNLTLIKGRILKIANGIIERGLDIQFDTPNGISLKTTDREIVDALVKAGLVRTCVAIESGSEFIRNQVIKKGLPTEKIYEFFRASERHRNLFVKAFFVIGYPQETRDTLNETLEMIKRIPIREVATFFVVPYPATELFNYCLEKHLLDLPMNNLHNLRTFSAVKGNNQVFIKPFSLEKDELVRFKAKAFAIVAEKNRNWYKEHPETTCSQEE